MACAADDNSDGNLVTDCLINVARPASSGVASSDRYGGQPHELRLTTISVTWSGFCMGRSPTLSKGWELGDQAVEQVHVVTIRTWGRHRVEVECRRKAVDDAAAIKPFQGRVPLGQRFR